MNNLIKLLNNDIQFSEHDLTRDIVSYLSLYAFDNGVSEAEKMLNVLMKIDKTLCKLDAEYPSFDSSYYFCLNYAKSGYMEVCEEKIFLRLDCIFIGKISFSYATFETEFYNYLVGKVKDCLEDEEAEYTESIDNYALFGVPQTQFI